MFNLSTGKQTDLAMRRPELRRTFVISALAVMAAGGLVMPTAAQQFPSRPITIIVPFSAGGTTDALARTVGEHLSKQFNQSVVIDNKAGAGGNIGAAAAARAAPDGHTLFLGTVGTHSINAALYRNMQFDPIKDFVPLTRLAMVPNILVANLSQPFSTVPELIAYAKANPGKVNYASAGNGGSQHLSGELFSSMAGVQMQHVPYKGSAPALQDLLGGQVNIMFDNLSASLPYLGAGGTPGKLKALAVTTSSRVASAPGLPTVAEAGVPGYEVNAWFGMLAPAKTPEPVLAKLQTALAAALADPAVRAKIQSMGGVPVSESSADFASYINAETKKWGALVTKIGLKLD